MAGNHNSGRKRKPTATLKLYGTYQRSRHESRDDERLAVGAPQKLVGMSVDGRHIFDLVTKTLPADVLSQLDGPMLAGTAEWFALYWSLYRTWRKAGSCDSETLAMATAAWKNFVAGASHFGMSPTSRAKFQKAAQDSGNDMEKFLQQV